MTIEVSVTGTGFMVAVTPPHGEWRSRAPMSATEVLAELGTLGCHSTEITDALDASGADWRPGHDAEVRRHREGA